LNFDIGNAPPLVCPMKLPVLGHLADAGPARLTRRGLLFLKR